MVLAYPPSGQEFWQILSQWVWNLRLELGQTCSPTPLRTTVFASANEPAPPSEPAPTDEAPIASAPVPTRVPTLANEEPSANEAMYGPPQWARPSFTQGFPGSAFLPQADGTLLCPAGRVLTLVERRQERANSVRVSYAARLDDCRLCQLRVQCQKPRTFKARQGSRVYWPLASHSLAVLDPPWPPDPPPCSPVLWRDWPRCHIRQKSDEGRALPNGLGDERDCTPVRSVSGTHSAHFHPLRTCSLAPLMEATAFSQRPSPLFAPGDRHPSWLARGFCSPLWICPLRRCIKSNGRPFLLAFSPMRFSRVASLYRYMSMYALLALLISACLFQARCASRGRRDYRNMVQLRCESLFFPGISHCFDTLEIRDNVHANKIHSIVDVIPHILCIRERKQ
jgi:hypothetical protein